MSRLFLINSPILIFIAIWISVFFLNSLHLYPFHKASIDSLGVLITGILAVIMGYLTASMTYFSSSKQMTASGNKSKKLLFNNIVLTKLTIITMGFLAFGGYGSFKVIAGLAGGAKFYFINPFLIRELVVAIQLNEIAHVPILYKISGFAISAGMLSNIFGGALFAHKGYRKLIAIIPIILTLIVSLVFIRRYSFVNGLTLWLVSYLYVYQILHQKDVKKLLYQMIIMTLTMVAIIYGVSYSTPEIARKVWHLE